MVGVVGGQRKVVPTGVALGALALGIYMISAAEAGWWLPGRAAAQQRADAAVWAHMSAVTSFPSADAKAIADEPGRIARALERSERPGQTLPDGKRTREDESPVATRRMSV